MSADTITVPFSESAERSVLGAILLDQAILHQARAILAPADFHLVSNRKIYSHILELESAGSGVDIHTLANRMGAAKELETFGGVAYLSSLTDGMPRRENIEHYAKIVKEDSQRRQMISLFNGAAELAADRSN